MRLSGLASGIDTDSMVKELMRAESVKVDRVRQDKQISEWRKEAYNDLNKELANFIIKSKEDLGLTTKTSMGTSVNNSYKNSKWVKNAISSDDSKLSAIANTNARDGVHTIKVNKLATGVKGMSTDNITVKGKEDATTVGERLDLGSEGTIKFSIKTKRGIKEFEFEKSVSLVDIANEINRAQIEGEDGEKISLGVKASYDSTLDRFFIETNDMGIDSTLKFESQGTDGSNFITALKLQNTSTNELIGEVEQFGRQSEIEYSIDGVIVRNDLKFDSNNFNISGINFTVKTEGISTVTVGTDTNGIIEKIKDFVEGYNKIVDKMNNLLGEKTHKNFRPLTDDQKEAMSDKEIELWEKKAKSGMLKDDPIVFRTVRNVRNGLYGSVKGSSGIFDHITNIGITTEEYASGSMGGKLQIDEAKLRKAIEDDVSGVMDLLFKQPDKSLAVDDDELSVSQLEEKRAQTGIFSRIFDNLTSGMKDIVEKSGLGDEPNLIRTVRRKIAIDFAIGGSESRIDKDVSAYDKKIADLSRYLKSKEDAYYRQFTAMEKAMQKANSQSAWLMQQFQ